MIFIGDLWYSYEHEILLLETYDLNQRSMIFIGDIWFKLEMYQFYWRPMVCTGHSFFGETIHPF